MFSSQVLDEDLKLDKKPLANNQGSFGVPRTIWAGRPS